MSPPYLLHLNKWHAHLPISQPRHSTQVWSIYFQNSLKTGHFFLSSLTLSCSKSLTSFAWMSLLLAFLASSSSSRVLYQKVDDQSIHSVDSHEFRRVQTSSHGLKTLHNLASAHLFSLISCTCSLPPHSVAFNMTRFVCLFVFYRIYHLSCPPDFVITVSPVLKIVL